MFKLHNWVQELVQSFTFYGGGGGGGQSQTTTSGIDPSMRPYVERGLSEAQKLYETYTPQYFAGPTFVGPSAQTESALQMAEQGYTQPVRRKDIKVLGKQALGMFLVGTDSMEAGKYISEHDKKIANKLAYVMAGGDLSEATLVSEQYLLDLEREAFLSLTGERKSLERIQYMLTKGKPLRN